jgi:hypothetical protein
MKKNLDPKIRVVAIGFGTEGFEAYEKGEGGVPFWEGEDLYQDQSTEVFKLGLEGVQKGSAFGLLNFSTIKAAVGGKSSTDPSKKGGDQYNLGGVIVFSASGEMVLRHVMKGFADHPDLAAVAKAAAA